MVMFFILFGLLVSAYVGFIFYVLTHPDKF